MLDFTEKSQYDFDDLVRLVKLLRGPGGCAWDMAQTHQSIRRNFIEEAYEACEAMDEGDPVHLREELGDVLLQVVFHAGIEADAGTFGRRGGRVGGGEGGGPGAPAPLLGGSESHGLGGAQARTARQANRDPGHGRDLPRAARAVAGG